ncbi:2OG-Fe(II) oxygenase [Massilia sp. PAMC28688]|uniref:2OG-Fe(II) oxygenase n=1 Tax=Massilia sp. PAMC28688 TaxID=2861283 RepID=UPI001C637B07|nr:2OG-Fe(II) oxygenase [Massilia sp. PAMC28688]QYF93393.1 2OG-Fe(II) oxygenase [Massilia sp. PAMC28688]
MDDFLEIYDNALTPAQCAQVIERFNASNKVVRGKTGQGVDTSKKDSYDLTISQHQEWHDLSNMLMGAVEKCLIAYMNKYRMLLVGAMSPMVVHPATGQPVQLSIDNFDECGTPYIGELMRTIYRAGLINVQKYLQSSGGYHHWHSEIYPQNPSCESLHRALLFQFYLNDVAEGGETEFFYQKRKIEARQGRLIIAPAGFTHTHKGHIARSGDKYIATSWILFQRAEALYGQPAP